MCLFKFRMCALYTRYILAFIFFMNESCLCQKYKLYCMYKKIGNNITITFVKCKIINRDCIKIITVTYKQLFINITLYFVQVTFYGNNFHYIKYLIRIIILFYLVELIIKELVFLTR